MEECDNQLDQYYGTCVEQAFTQKINNSTNISDIKDIMDINMVRTLNKLKKEFLKDARKLKLIREHGVKTFDECNRNMMELLHSLQQELERIIQRLLN